MNKLPLQKGGKRWRKGGGGRSNNYRQILSTSQFIRNLSSPTALHHYSWFSNFRFLSTVFVRLLFLAFFVALAYILLFKGKGTPLAKIFDLKREKEFTIRFKNIQMLYRMDVPPVPPCPAPTKLLILVMTRRNGFEKRNSIRQTWAKEKSPHTVIRFIMGEPSGPVVLANFLAEQRMLDEEQQRHGDLIPMHAIEDAYANLHLKWTAALQWQQAFCPHTEFVMKSDDDTVVHLARLEHWIEAKFRTEMAKNTATLFGWVITGKQPIRLKNHRWYVSESAYPEKSYPDYLQGATYLATSAAISALLNRTGEVGGFNMDDVLFTGILANAAGVPRSDQKLHFCANFERLTDAQLKGDFCAGNRLDKNDKCAADGTPFAVAAFGAQKLVDFEHLYGQLKQIKCASPK